MNRFLNIIGLLAFLSSCSNTQRCNELEEKIMNVCAETDSTYTIPLASLTDFEWDTLYVISGPTVDNEAGDFIGMDYEKTIPDNSRQYIFVENGKVVKEYSSYCTLNLSALPSYSIGYKYSSTSQIQVQKKEGEGTFTYKVTQL